jgi:hypothetical protein
MPHRRALPSWVLTASILLGGCSEDRSARVLPPAQSDFAALRDFWNEGDLAAFVALADETRFLDDRAQVVGRIEELHASIGRIRQQADPLVDSVPADPRAYAVVHQLGTAERGVVRFSLVYDEQLRIVGFEVQAPSSLPASPR